jgi:hypothetical protein
VEYVLKFRWGDSVMYLTKDDNIKPVPVDSEQVRAFHSRESAEQYQRHAFGAKSELYVSTREV